MATVLAVMVRATIMPQTVGHVYCMCYWTMCVIGQCVFCANKVEV